ncbi:MAG TPA: DUF1573 domain-containing protein [Cyclobacteriaceae bacterium]|jgi:hypothetical protein|nr:DUF1573 domain-containing protein [Cyclobacteriaceae bacterium]
MKSSLRNTLVALALGVIVVGCKNKEAERIADLEKQPVESASTPVSPVAETAPADVKPEGPLPSFQFEKSEHDFGTITEGDVVEYTYSFVNNGEAPLIIQGAQGSCGCTVPEWTKEPVPVGGKGFVKAKFNSSGKHDLQNKTVTITANTWPKQTVLKFTAMVKEKAAAK